MKISMMSYTVSRQANFFDLKKMLDLTAELKLDGIDFVTLHSEKPEILKKMCDDRKIKVVCHTFIADLNHPTTQERHQAIDICKRGIENAVILGAPIIMIPTLVKTDRSAEQSRKNWIAGLKEIAPLACDAGITLTIENFPGMLSAFVTAEHFLEAAVEIPDLKLTYDSGNAGTGEDPVESFKKTASYVVHAHFKDWDRSDSPVDGYNKMLDGKYYRPSLIGEGCIPHKTVLSAMKATGYDGCINIEYEGNKYDPYEGIRRAVDYLRSLEL